MNVRSFKCIKHRKGNNRMILTLKLYSRVFSFVFPFKFVNLNIYACLFFRLLYICLNFVSFHFYIIIVLRCLFYYFILLYFYACFVIVIGRFQRQIYRISHKYIHISKIHTQKKK